MKACRKFNMTKHNITHKASSLRRAVRTLATRAKGFGFGAAGFRGL